MPAKSKIVKAHCNKCLGETHHFVLTERRQNFEDTDETGRPYFWEMILYELLECCGCETITLRQTYESNAEEQIVSYFPPAVSRPKPAWMRTFVSLSQHDTFSLFREVYEALHNGSNRLAIMGARSIIDTIMVDKIGDPGTFAQKLDKMQQAGFISAKNRDYLKAAIEAGNAAAHRGFCHQDKDVHRVMDIVENLFQTVYVLDSAAKALENNTPSRSDGTKKAPPKRY